MQIFLNVIFPFDVATSQRELFLCIYNLTSPTVCYLEEKNNLKELSFTTYFH